MKLIYAVILFASLAPAVTGFAEGVSADSNKKKSLYDGKDGRAEAKHDISIGRLAFKTKPPTALGAKTFNRLLKERYGIESDIIDWDEIDDAQVHYVVAYNFEMRMLIEQKIPGCTRTFRLLFEECVESEKKSAKPLLPTPASVTDRADARFAPDAGAADL